MSLSVVFYADMNTGCNTILKSLTKLMRKAQWLERRIFPRHAILEWLYVTGSNFPFQAYDTFPCIGMAKQEIH